MTQGRRQHLEYLEERAAQQNVSLSCGRIQHVGQNRPGGLDSTGGFHVEYIVSATGSGYVSYWPSWAFELAKAALLYNKEICVISNGDPLGDNILGVYVQENPP